MEVNTDDDLESHDFKLGEDVDIYVEEFNSWKKGKIGELQGNQVKILVGQKEIFEDKDS